MAPRWRLAAAGLAAALLAAGIAGQVLENEPDGGYKPALGLFTSLPIYWAETANIADALDQEGRLHWARTALEAENRLVPLDTLDLVELKQFDRLVIAQPRPFAPAENVALDEWVRDGGRLLLFADPFLTEHSRFSLGDKRRPQGMVLLSPILRRWGLELRFDEDQPGGLRQIGFEGVQIPVDLAGTFAPVGPGHGTHCAFAGANVIAWCRVGAGFVVVVADAAVLDGERPSLDALTTLLNSAFTS